MHPPFKGVDAVGEGVKAVRIETRIPLKGNLNLLAIFDTLQISNLTEERLLGGIHVSHKITDATLVTEFDLVVPFVGSIVTKTDSKTTIEEGHHLKPLGKGLEPKAGLIEDASVRPESDRRPSSPVWSVTNLCQSGF